MLDTYITLRSGSSYWQIRVPVPKDVQADFGKVEHNRSLRERDRAKAEIKAVQMIADLHAQWDAIREQRVLGGGNLRRAGEPSDAELHAIARDVYAVSVSVVTEQRANRLSERPDEYDQRLDREERYLVHAARRFGRGDVSTWEAAAENQAAKRGFLVDRSAPWFRRLTEIVAEMTLTALDVENRRDRGELNPQPRSDALERANHAEAVAAATRSDVTFSALVEDYMIQWRAGMKTGKETNSEAQKLATFKLFGGFWRDQSIRGVEAKEAAEFHDILRLFDPNWSRSPAARELDWNGLVGRFGGQANGLAFATMNRHMRALQGLWAWARKRGHCEGENPFEGYTVKLRPHVNTFPYLPWEDDELTILFNPPPKRADLREVMIVGMFTGMRLDEIASLTWGMVRVDVVDGQEISYFDIADAKTAAGRRQVPVHSQLGWLLRRDRGASDERIWASFNPEGPGKKAGADASREFSRFKTGKGFEARAKTFHSFRKNVTRIIERAGVLENEWAQVFGHERGFTYGTYNPDGITLRRKAEIIELIGYPNLAIPHPA